MMYTWEPGYDDFYSTRPVPDAQQYATMREQWRNEFTASLDGVCETLEDLRAAATDHEAERASQGLSASEYEKFLDEFNANETQAQRSDRLTANYVRHVLTPYDSILERMKREWDISEQFFVDVWGDAMAAIVIKFPEIESARTRGLAAKEKFARHLESF